jgi:hypothetical protein
LILNGFVPAAVKSNSHTSNFNYWGALKVSGNLVSSLIEDFAVRIFRPSCFLPWLIAALWSVQTIHVQPLETG